MNIGDLVKSSKNNDYYGEIGIVTELPNDGFFAMVTSKHGRRLLVSPQTLEVIK